MYFKYQIKNDVVFVNILYEANNSNLSDNDCGYFFFPFEQIIQTGGAVVFSAYRRQLPDGPCPGAGCNICSGNENPTEKGVSAINKHAYNYIS